MMKAGRTLIVIASGLLLAALGFPLYWMLASSLTPESQLFEAAPLVPRAPSRSSTTAASSTSAASLCRSATR